MIAYMSAFNSRLSAFLSHSLKDLNSTALMNRVDSIFEFNGSILLKEIYASYAALQIEDRRIFRCEHIFFDISSLLFCAKYQIPQLNCFKKLSVKFRSIKSYKYNNIYGM